MTGNRPKTEAAMSRTIEQLERELREAHIDRAEAQRTVAQLWYVVCGLFGSIFLGIVIGLAFG